MTAPLLPGAVIGILGGGPCGRATALAARALGYQVRALDSDVECTIGPIAERAVVAPLDAAAAAAEVLAGCDVVTATSEWVPLETLAAVERAGATIRPAIALYAVARDRVREREWLTAVRAPVAPWRAVASADEARDAFEALGRACVIKPAVRSSDAPGARRVAAREDVEDAWRMAGGGRCVMEQELRLEAELSVVVARTSDGTMATYPAAQSCRADRDGVPRLVWSVIPATVPGPIAERARARATAVAEAVGAEGLLAVEMFLLSDGQLVVNELVPCPHASYQGAEQACATGQYEQLVRAICGLPLGATTLVQPTAVAPLYGEVWSVSPPPRLDQALRVPSAVLRAYGFHAAPPDRAVGHLAAAGASAEEAVRRVLRAGQSLAPPRASRPRDPAVAATGAAPRSGWSWKSGWASSWGERNCVPPLAVD